MGKRQSHNARMSFKEPAGLSASSQDGTNVIRLFSIAACPEAKKYLLWRPEMSATAKIRETVARELDKLPDEELMKLLDYIRFLKLKSLPDAEIGARFSSALVSASQIARQEGITEREIQEEIERSRNEI